MTDKKNRTDDKNSDDKKVGVYICHCGGNISDHVDVHELAERAAALPGVEVTHTNMFMCSDPGQELIQEDIKSGKINRVVVASCAPSLHELTFRSAIKRADMNPYQYEHANIREQVSWVHDGKKATHKATTLVAAAIAKAKHLKVLEPIRVDAKNHATVIGGGIAGLRAASDLAVRGIEVALIEKTPFLGGQVARLDTLAPTGEKADAVVKKLAEAVVADPMITVYTCSKISHSEGYVGNFKVTVTRHPPETVMDIEKSNAVDTDKATVGEYISFAGYFPVKVPETAEEINLDTGVIVFATGFQTYVPDKGEYGFEENAEVITLPELIRLMAGGPDDKKILEIDGQKIRRMAFIHCVGSRQIPGIHEPAEDGILNEYCSRTCCSVTLQAAVDIREKYPETRVFEYYRDIRTYGRGQEEIYEQASKQGVLFFRFEPEDPPVVARTEKSGFPLKVTVKDTLTFGKEVAAEVDLVVLSVGMEPSRITDLVEMMKLPVGADRFLQEVHPKLRPVEVANLGILLAGTCQAPMDVGEACVAAQAAAAKSSTLLSRDYVELDPFVAEVDLSKCTGKGKCATSCPIDGALEMQELEVEGQKAVRAQVNPALCNGCGICVAECPGNAIDVNGWTLRQYEEMVDAIVAA